MQAKLESLGVVESRMMSLMQSIEHQLTARGVQAAS